MGPTAEGFYLLSGNPDTFEITPGLLDGLPNGLLALDGDDTVTGSAEADTINGNLGNDLLILGAGNDRVWGGKNNDVILGAEGNDTINGNLDTDFIQGGSGDDILRGGKNDDVLLGEAGNDFISGDLGFDAIIGGAGDDTFVARLEPSPNGTEADQFLDFTPNVDQIGLPGGQTEADLILENAPIDLSQELLNLVGLGNPQGLELPPEFLEIFTPEFLRQFYIEAYGVDVDPDADGIIQGTGVLSRRTGLQVFYVFNVSPDQLVGQFVSLSDADLAVG